jgi:hypothetical protein
MFFLCVTHFNVVEGTSVPVEPATSRISGQKLEAADAPETFVYCISYQTTRQNINNTSNSTVSAAR